MPDQGQPASRPPCTADVCYCPRRMITIHDMHSKPVVRIPVPDLSYPPNRPLFQPSPILGDPYLPMQKQLLSLYLIAEAAHQDAICQRSAWIKDIGPLIVPSVSGPRCHQFYLALGALERTIRVTLWHMEDRAVRFRYIGRARELRNVKTEEYVEEKEMERARLEQGPGFDMRSKDNMVGGHVIEEVEELRVFPDPQCPDYEEVTAEWGHLMQARKVTLRDLKRPVTEINDSVAIRTFNDNYDSPCFD
ncbi:hypothetical protein EV426DRAFT_703748 [Tirmania nivea]|nr:hypothetical protein EV426DRAFT_703748 [Tirmania nivea]